MVQGLLIRDAELFDRLIAERKRTAHATRLLDFTASVLLFADAALLAHHRALPAVFALSLALAIALAAVLLEPATTLAAFGEESDAT